MKRVEKPALARLRTSKAERLPKDSMGNHVCTRHPRMSHTVADSPLHRMLFLIVRLGQQKDRKVKQGIKPTPRQHTLFRCELADNRLYSMKSMWPEIRLAGLNPLWRACVELTVSNSCGDWTPRNRRIRTPSGPGGSSGKYHRLCRGLL
jgi:hypothetical protein